MLRVRMHMHASVSGRRVYMHASMLMEVVSLCARSNACVRMRAYFISVFECAMSRLRMHMYVGVADVSVCM
jgi:hypothetical protein